MKNKYDIFDLIQEYKGGIVFCLMIIASLYFIIIEPVFMGYSSISYTRRLLIEIAWLVFILIITFDNKSRQHRISKFGSSNIFIALFKKQK